MVAKIKEKEAQSAFAIQREINSGCFCIRSKLDSPQLERLSGIGIEAEPNLFTDRTLNSQRDILFMASYQSSEHKVPGGHKLYFIRMLFSLN